MNITINNIKQNALKSISKALPLHGGVGGGLLPLRGLGGCVGGCVLLLGLLTSCSDQFLSDKKNYDNVNTGIYDYYEGAYARISDIYSWCLPDPSANANWKYNCTGNADDQSKSTEEYSGFSVFVNPDAEMMVQNGTATVPDYFHNQANNIQASVWGRIRNINDVIEGISAGSLAQEKKDELLGQAYFFRAWCYYQMVKWYGGVPIVKEVIEPEVTNSTPRSSTKECIDFILSDLDKSATMLKAATLNGGWKSGNDWGHVTTGTALALKGRVLLLWASPIFNRANDESRWKDAYSVMKAELDSIQRCGYALYASGNNVNGSDFAAVFSQTRCCEDVFVTLFNTIQSGDTQKNNPWERGIRPKNTTGSGLNPSAMIVDMFPMADGTLPSTCKTFTKLPHSVEAYESQYPFMNRDPRFYRTFAFPGVRWAYNGDPTQQDPNNPSYDNGANYVLWNYVWYTDAKDRDNMKSSNCYGADNLLGNCKGMYVRKRSDDLDVNSSPLYSNWSASANQSGFIYSAAPYVEIRYAEVLLNLAEAAAGANDLAYAKQCLDQVRQRAGAPTGVYDNLSDQGAVMSAVLYERLVELAYEGKRFDDLRRWMLFDGGTGIAQIEGAPATWKLTGWGGNTCTWLGFTPLNGQRRENMEFRVSDNVNDGLGGTTAKTDPLINEIPRDEWADYVTPLDLRKPVADQQDQLKSFYSEYFTRKTKKGDAYDSNQTEEYMKFYAKYYLLGLPYGALSTDANLEQTIGWQDTNKGGANGTFDPLAK